MNKTGGRVRNILGRMKGRRRLRQKEAEDKMK